MGSTDKRASALLSHAHIVFLFFPAMVYSDLESMNWAIVMFTGIMAIALICYFLHGRKNTSPLQR